MTSKPKISVRVVFADILNVLFMYILTNSASKYGEQDRKMIRKELHVVVMQHRQVHAFTRIRLEGHHKLINYTGCPQGRPCLGLGRLSFFFFFFFTLATNLHINLFIKLSPLLEGMYCSNCLQQKRPNENLLLARISWGREPPHPYLCDVNSSFDLFIKPGLNSGGHIAYKF